MNKLKTKHQTEKARKQQSLHVVEEKYERLAWLVHNNINNINVEKNISFSQKHENRRAFSQESF